MKFAVAVSLMLLALPSIACSQSKENCSRFNQLIKTTYNFKPSKLTDEERDAKAADMDKVWNMARANSKELVPCLRAAIESPDADQWFRFDGSNLLVTLDPSREAKALQLRSYTQVDLKDVDLQIWVQTLALLGADGFNVAEAGERWLRYREAEYFLPRHGLYAVRVFPGALFIYGSMDEAQATPALLQVMGDRNHPGREDALLILMSQATPESLLALKALDASAFSGRTQESLRVLLSNPELLTPRAIPKTSRAAFLKAFQEIVNGKWDQFFELVSEVPDGERDVVAVLKPEDIPSR